MTHKRKRGLFYSQLLPEGAALKQIQVSRRNKGNLRCYEQSQKNVSFMDFNLAKRNRVL